jgi:hypothetical protein
MGQFFYVPSGDRSRLAKISKNMYDFLKEHTVKNPWKEKDKYQLLLKMNKPVFKSFDEGSDRIFQEWLTKVYKGGKRGKL